MPPEIYDAAIRYKAGLARRETAIMRNMASNWLGVIRSLEGDMEDVARRMAQRRAQGLGVTVGQLYRTERYAQLLQQAYKELGKYEQYAADYIASNQDVFARLGQQNGLSLLGIIEPGIAGSFNRLNVRATQTIAGFVADGSPLRQLLSEAWPHAIDQTTQALVRGIGAGYGPKRIARMMSQGLSAGFRRSLVIARTETLRAYRVSTMEAWRETGYVIGWQRVATHDRRTCPACLFSEGAFIPFEEDFAEHPQGRCVAIPVTRRSGMAKWEYGPDWLERQSQSTQVAILGKGRHAAWKAGRFDLYDIPQQITNPTWGNGMRARSLAELLADAKGGSQRDRWLRRVEPNSTVPLGMPELVPVPVFSSGKEAADWLVSQGYVKAADFGKLDKDAINAVVRSVTDSSSQFKRFHGSLDFVGSAQARRSTLAESMKNVFVSEAKAQGLVGSQIDRYVEIMTKKYKPLLTKVPDSIYAYYQTSKVPGADGLVSELVINEKWGKKSSVLAEQLEGAVSRGWHPQGVTTIKGVLDHETAHALDNLYKIAGDSRLTDLWLDAQRIPGGIADNLSQYATTNKDEFIAEAWAEYLNNPMPRPLAQSIGALIREIANDSN